MQPLSRDLLRSGYRPGEDFPEDPPEEREDEDGAEDVPISNEVAVDASGSTGASVAGGSSNSTEAPLLRSIRDIVADLAKPISPRHIRTRKQGGVQISFIEWTTAVRYLDHYAAGWFFEIRQVEVVRATDETKTPDRLVIVVRIGIPAAEGIVWREATGFEWLNTDSYGDSSSNAEAMALKRAAAKFQLGLHLYLKDS